MSALALLSALVALGVRAAPPPLLVVEVAEDDHAAAQRLLELTEQPTQLVRMPEARDPARALPLARAALADRVVIFDQGAQRVVVLATRDGSVLTRTTATEGAPFMAAFVAVELLALPAPEPQPAPPPAPVQAPPPRRTTVLGVRAGLEVLPLVPYQGALRPAVGLFLSSHRPRASLGFRVELWAAPHATHSQASSSGRLSLTRDDLAARAGALWAHDRLALSGFSQLGVARIVAVQGAPQREPTRRAVLALGLGLEPSVSLWPWLALYASSSLIAHAPPADYRVDGASVLRERRLTWTLGAGVYVTLPI